MRPQVTNPTITDLRAVAAFAQRFEEPGFSPGEWTTPAALDDGTIQIGWWSPTQVIVEWNEALYDHHIVGPETGYLERSNIDFVHKAIEEPELLNGLDLPSVRRVLTFLARAERHADGGWYASAFRSGMAQAATRRLGELASEMGQPGAHGPSAGE